MILGVVYWAVWRVILPKIFGYELVPNKVVLKDGTIVNVVRSFSFYQPFFFGCMADPSICFFYLLKNSLNESKNKLPSVCFTFDNGSCHMVYVLLVCCINTVRAVVLHFVFSYPSLIPRTLLF